MTLGVKGVLHLRADPGGRNVTADIESMVRINGSNQWFESDSAHDSEGGTPPHPNPRPRGGRAVVTAGPLP